MKEEKTAERTEIVPSDGSYLQALRLQHEITSKMKWG